MITFLTSWFFVFMYASNGIWHLDPTMPPVETATPGECQAVANSLMIDRRNPAYWLVCIEADDREDLAKILWDNFDFGQDRGDPA